MFGMFKTNEENEKIVEKYTNLLRERLIGAEPEQKDSEQDGPETVRIEPEETPRVYMGWTDAIRKSEAKEGEAKEGEVKTSGAKGEAILELMIRNLGEIKDYYLISKDHAKASFVLAVIACLVGLLLLFVSAVSALNAKDVSSSVMTAIGGVVVELFAGTVLIVYNKSISQLNRYYDSLRESERLLYSANLVAKMSKGRRDDAYMEIIKSAMKDAPPPDDDGDERKDDNADKDNKDGDKE